MGIYSQDFPLDSRVRLVKGEGREIVPRKPKQLPLGRTARLPRYLGILAYLLRSTGRLRLPTYCSSRKQPRTSIFSRRSTRSRSLPDCYQVSRALLGHIRPNFSLWCCSYDGRRLEDVCGTDKTPVILEQLMATHDAGAGKQPKKPSDVNTNSTMPAYLVSFCASGGAPHQISGARELVCSRV